MPAAMLASRYRQPCRVYMRRCAQPSASPSPQQAYVRQRIQRFVSQPALSRRLGAEAAATLQAATQELLATGDALPGSTSAALLDQRELQLAFRHDCR